MIERISPILDFDKDTAWRRFQGKPFKASLAPGNALNFPTFQSYLIKAIEQDGQPELIKEN